MKKIAILIDGGYLRVGARKQQKKYTANLIERIGLASKAADRAFSNPRMSLKMRFHSNTA
jgi:hypothetical protein